MNPIQRQLFGPGVAVMLAMLICPPWAKITHRVVLGAAGRNSSVMQTETQEFAGYSLLWEPPQAQQLVQAPNYAVPGDYNETVKIDFDRLLLQWLTVVFLYGAGWLYFKDSDKESLREWWSTLQRSPKPRPPSDPPVSSSLKPPAIGGGETKQRTSPNQRSSWRRARKPAGTAFGFGSFVGIASACRPGIQKGFSFGGGMFFAFYFGLFCGLLFAAVTYLVAALFYAVKGEAKGAVEPHDSKAEKKTRNNVCVWILAVIGVLCVIGVSKPVRDAVSYAFADPDRDERSPASQPVASPAGEAKELDAKAQAAAEFDRDFFLNYPDLKPYRAVVDAVASRLQASGFKADSREAVMEKFATEARREIATLGWRYEHGDGVEQNYTNAAYWYRQAAEHGDASAQNNLGVLYEMGRGVPQDPVAAFIWYGASAAQGSFTARSNANNLASRLTPDQLREWGRRVRASLDAIPPATAPK